MLISPCVNFGRGNKKRFPNFQASKDLTEAQVAGKFQEPSSYFYRMFLLWYNCAYACAPLRCYYGLSNAKITYSKPVALMVIEKT